MSGSVRGRARAELLERVAPAADPLSVFAEASTRLRRIVPFSAAVWRATDPSTGMMTSPVRVENLDDDGCAVYWESELLAENVNAFRDLARGTVAAGLWDATGGLPERSALYRQYLRPRGLADELKTVLLADGRPWGSISLFREQGRMPFTPADIEFLAGLSAPLARRLRSFAAPGPGNGAVAGPGLLLFAADGALLSVNEDARRHLDAMPAGPGTPSAFGLTLPVWLTSTALRARAIAEGHEHGEARMRIRTRAGHWLVCHASCLRGPDGGIGQTAMVVEAAPTSETVPLVLAAYELTERERGITRLIARGLATGEIATTLHLSPHTVRDHIKTIFARTGVSSRGELVAKLFAEDYEPLSGTGTERVRT